MLLIDLAVCDLLLTMPVLTIQRVTLDLARDLLLTMPVLTLQRVTLDLPRDLLLTMPVLTISTCYS